MVFRTNILLPSGEGSLEIIEGPDGMIHSFQIPQSYIPDEKERMTQEGFARLAECTSQLVDLTNDWKKSYGDVSASLQKSMLTLHLHACTRTLGIDLVGLKQNSKGEMDCVLRSPGLRPRHWAYICQSLPGGIPTNGLDVFFPARFSSTKTQVEKSDGGVDIKELLTNPSYGDDEEEWDALDQEEVEAMKQISSAKLVTDLDEINIDDTPYFIVKNKFGGIWDFDNKVAEFKDFIDPSGLNKNPYPSLLEIVIDVDVANEKDKIFKFIVQWIDEEHDFKLYELGHEYLPNTFRTYLPYGKGFFKVYLEDNFKGRWE